MMPISNIHPDLWVGMMESYYKGDVDEAKRMEAILLPMTKVVMKYGAGGIKAAMDIIGYYGGPPLLPLKAPSAEGIDEIRLALSKVEGQIKA